MSRPGLIVGLGGTGQWVLTWLKRDLMLANGGVMPSNVRLLSIDTATQLEAGVRKVDGREEEAVQFGDVRLEKGEFIYVGGNARPLVQRVAANELPQIGRWYHAERWLDALTPAAFVLDNGAGRIRQFGRLAIYKDLLGQQANSHLWTGLRTAIDSVRRETDEQRSLEIIVVGSFAGGTGSGMFLDVALLLRLLANKAGVHHILRSFFALPSVFATAPTAEMKARSFAAWRELNRFMVVASDFHMPTIQYVERNNDLQIEPRQKIFDACYLVDGRRNGAPLADEAKKGVHPMVAEVISAILDEDAGKVFTEYVTTNLAPEYARTPNIPLFSAVGAYTLQVPAHFKQEKSTLAFTTRLLEKILVPRGKTRDSSGAARHLSLAAPDQNQEEGLGAAGRTRAAELLSTQTVIYGAESASPSLFTARLANMVNMANDHGKRATLIEQEARAGTEAARKGGTQGGWMDAFTNLGNDPDAKDLQRNATLEKSFSIPRSYERQKGETPEQVRTKARRIPEDIRARYGGVSSQGEIYGSFGNVLQELQQYHITLFRRLVRLRLLEILNVRTTEDPLRAKSGKLGYAWDYFDGLANLFDEFLSIMNDVSKVRQEKKPEVKLQEQVANAHRRMEQRARDKWVGLIEPPGVKQSEDEFFKIQQLAVELRREVVLHHFVTQTALQMREICIQTRDALQRWIWHLATGDDPSQVTGLWRDLQARLKQVEDDHGYDRNLKAVQALVAEGVQEAEEADVAAALRQWEWKADYRGTALQLQVEIKPEAADDAPSSMVDPSQEVSEAVRRQVGQRNRQRLEQLGRRRYQRSADKTTVADALKAEYTRPEELADEVAPGAEPLFEGDVQATPRRKSNLIRVQAPESDTYFRGPGGLEGILRNAQNLDPIMPDDLYNISVVNSENQYKLTLVRTDDLYPPEAFAAWQECMEAYIQHFEEGSGQLDPVLMHNFAAEANAVTYERAFMRDHEAYRPLHPRVVMLLENPQAMRQFFYLAMLNHVRLQKSQDLRWWELTYATQNQSRSIWLTLQWNAAHGLLGKEPDVMHALHRYVIVGSTAQPRSTAPIEYKLVEQFLKTEWQRLGPGHERKVLEDNFNHGGFIGWLERQAVDPDDPDEVVRPDLYDLARVGRKMLQERLETLKHVSGRDGSDMGGFHPSEEEEAPPPEEVAAIAEAAAPAEPPTPLGAVRMQPQRFRQFLYLGMLGMFEEKEDRRGYRWMLVWPKGDEDQTFWLTEPWEANAKTAGTPQPTILDALVTYALRSHSLRPGHADSIDYDFAEHLIRAEQQAMGPEEETTLLDDNLGDEGWIASLRAQAYDPNVPGRVVRQEFLDVAAAAEQLLEDRLDELKKRRRGTAGSGGFKTRHRSDGQSGNSQGGRPTTTAHPVPDAWTSDGGANGTAGAATGIDAHTVWDMDEEAGQSDAPWV
ncbi:MAG TPA: tubulin-like doman-containing protein [Ardenticatenaceae bacterium]